MTPDDLVATRARHERIVQVAVHYESELIRRTASVGEYMSADEAGEAHTDRARLLERVAEVEGERAEEGVRADENFTSYERVKAFYSDKCNEALSLRTTRDAAEAERDSLREQLRAADYVATEVGKARDVFVLRAEAAEAENVRLREALALPLMFHAGGKWDEEQRAEWYRLAGTYDATTKVMCDTIRAALALTRAEPEGRSR